MYCNCPVALPGTSLAGRGSSSLLLFMAVLEQFLRTQCDIEDPCGQIDPIANPLPEYDFIVVGGGSAGSVVASRLSEVPEWKVLLVEAGGNEPTLIQVPSFWQSAQNTSIDWQYVTEPETTAFLNNGGRANWPKGKVIGGTSTINAMIYVRGNRKDYDSWEAMGNTGWSYSDVLPYFMKSENNLQINSVDKGYHGIGGYLQVSYFPYLFPFEEDIFEGLREMGAPIGDLNGKKQTKFSILQTNSRNGIRYSSSRAFLRPVKHRRNLHILLNAFVTNVLINFENKKAFGVEIIKKDGTKEVIVSKKEVILCGGTIGSPQILLQSGVGDETSLKDKGKTIIHHLPGVGRNLHDQVGYRVYFSTNHTNVNDLNWAVAMNYLLFRDGAMSTTGSSVVGFVQSSYANQSENYPDLRFQFGGYSASFSKTGDIDEISGVLLNSTTKPNKQINMRCTLVRPISRGYLTLRDENPMSRPKLFAGYLSNPADIPPIIEGIKLLINISKSESLRKYDLELNTTHVKGCEDLLFGSDSYWECAIRRQTDTVNHEVGTCKMGPSSDPEAVVDPQLRVWGVRSLRVVDASVMPRVTTGNTHSTTVMIGEKGSDMIKHYWLKVYKPM